MQADGTAKATEDQVVGITDVAHECIQGNSRQGQDASNEEAETQGEKDSAKTEDGHSDSDSMSEGTFQRLLQDAVINKQYAHQ